jgi:hypothetical protein
VEDLRILQLLHDTRHGIYFAIPFFMSEPIDISLDFNGMHYTGWATPSESGNDNGWPKSFHVVLNETMFGNVSYNDGKWTVDEWRPEGMADAVGAAIQSKYKPASSVKQ